jgi:hypothetical protein
MPEIEEKGWLKNHIKEIIALIMIPGGGYAFMIAPESKATVIASLITAVIGFYFGSAVGSRTKDRALEKLAEKNGSCLK